MNQVREASVTIEVCLESNNGSDDGRKNECSDTGEPRKSQEFLQECMEKGPEVVLRGEGIRDSTYMESERTQFLLHV